MKNGLKLIVPVPHRKNLSKDVVITRGIDGCLFLYSEKNWEKTKDGLTKYTNETNPKDTIRFVGLFLSGAEKIKMSNDGKIIIPLYLVDFANIKKDIVFIRVGTRLSIWAKEEFEKYRDKTKNKISKDILEQISFGRI
jgi:MraZ protein